MTKLSFYIHVAPEFAPGRGLKHGWNPTLNNPIRVAPEFAPGRGLKPVRVRLGMRSNASG